MFPEVASRQHIKTIYAIVDQALQAAHLSLSDLDAIAVTRGPGWLVRWWWGSTWQKAWRSPRNLPLVGVNHLEGHIYSAWVYPVDEKPPSSQSFRSWRCLSQAGIPS